MSDSVRPHRRQPTRLPRPWDFPGKNTGVGCHFLLQYMKMKSESEVAQSCPTLRDPMDCSLPGSSVHGIFQARVLEWVAIAFSFFQYICPLNFYFLKTFSSLNNYWRSIDTYDPRVFQIMPLSSLCCKPQGLEFWLAECTAKQTWFSNKRTLSIFYLMALWPPHI